MTDVGRIAVWAVCQILIVTALWLVAVLILRRNNFLPSGERRTELRGASDDIRARQIEYQNTASYRAFEFFLKVSLAILGGIAFLSVQADSIAHDKIKVLIVSGAWLLLLAAVVFSAVVFIHPEVEDRTVATAVHMVSTRLVGRVLAYPGNAYCTDGSADVDCAVLTRSRVGWSVGACIVAVNSAVEQTAGLHWLVAAVHRER